MQAAFVTEALRLLRAEGVHTALDTCGFGRWPDLRDAAAHANLVLYDLKLMDAGPPQGRHGRVERRHPRQPAGRWPGCTRPSGSASPSFPA